MQHARCANAQKCAYGEDTATVNILLQPLQAAIVSAFARLRPVNAHCDLLYQLMIEPRALSVSTASRCTYGGFAPDPLQLHLVHTGAPAHCR